LIEAVIEPKVIRIIEVVVELECLNYSLIDKVDWFLELIVLPIESFSSNDEIKYSIGQVVQVNDLQVDYLNDINIPFILSKITGAIEVLHYFDI
jgi:hypothetical protein